MKTISDDRVIAAVARDGVLDVAYRTMDTPVGSLLLAATEQGTPAGRLR